MEKKNETLIFLLEDEIVKRIKKGRYYSLVKKIVGKPFKAPNILLQEPLQCKFDSIKVFKYCLCEDKINGDCESYFCEFYSPVTGNII